MDEEVGVRRVYTPPLELAKVSGNFSEEMMQFLALGFTTIEWQKGDKTRFERHPGDQRKERT